MRDYLIKLVGSEGDTEIQMPLTDEQAELLRTVAEEMTSAADRYCPTMHIATCG